MKTSKFFFNPSLVYDLEVLNDYIINACDASIADGGDGDPALILPEVEYTLCRDGHADEHSVAEGSLLAFLADAAMSGKGPKTCHEVPTDSDICMTLEFEFCKGDVLFLTVLPSDWYDIYFEQIDNASRIAS